MGIDDGLVHVDDIKMMSPEEAAAFRLEDETACSTIRVSSTRKLFESSGLEFVGDGQAPLDQIAQLLLKSDLIDDFGGVLNSPEASLKSNHRSDIYFLGLNPGGAAPTDAKGTIESGYTTIYESLAMCRLGVSGWDQNWSRDGATYPPGEAPLQRRFKHVARHLGIPYSEIFATNLIFARSSRFSEVPSVAQQIKLCQPVHELMMSVVQPKRLWVMGNPTHAGDVLTIRDAEWQKANHADWMIGRGIADFCGHTVQFCHTPHLSIWDATAADKQKLLDFTFRL